jgi:hypothetical protein
MAQPNCSTCGRFVGRDVRVLKYRPLRVQCDLCVYEEALEARRVANMSRVQPEMVQLWDALACV